MKREIVSNRNIVKSQPVAFSILQRIIESGLIENQLLLLVQIITKDMNYTLPNDNQTYLESLSKDLERYPSVKDNLKSLDSDTKKKQFYLQILSQTIPILQSYVLLLSIHITMKVNILNKLSQTEQKSRSIIIILVIIYHFILLWILSLLTKEHSIIPNNLKLKNTKIVKKKKKFNKKRKKRNLYN